MKEETRENLGFIVCMVTVFWFGSAVTQMGVDWSWRRQIAGHHCAEFYIDGNNYRQWRWLDCNPKSK